VITDGAARGHVARTLVSRAALPLVRTLLCRSLPARWRSPSVRAQPCGRGLGSRSRIARRTRRRCGCSEPDEALPRWSSAARDPPAAVFLV